MKNSIILAILSALFFLTGCTPYLVSENCNRFNCDKACHSPAAIKLNSGMRRMNACHQFCSNLNKCNCSPVQNYCSTKINNNGSATYDSYRVYPCKNNSGCGQHHGCGNPCHKGPASCKNYRACQTGY